MNSIHNEKRRFDRIFHDATTFLTNKSSEEIPCKLLDISLNGCLVSTNSGSNTYRVNEQVNVCITLTDVLSIKTSAHIAFVADKGNMGLQFDEIDIDSITTLRRLVELNMGESTLLERNLHSLGSVKGTNVT